MIDIENISDKTLLRVVKDGADMKCEYLALKVLMSRFRLKFSIIATKGRQYDELEKQCCAEMRELFFKSINIPNAMKDLKVILERFDTHEVN